MLELKQMQAQIDLINAQRLKTEAETPKTGNLGDVAVGKGAQEIENLKADTALKYINGEVAKIMTTANVEQIDANVEQIKANTAKLETEGKILAGQANDILQQTAINTMQKKLEMELTQANIAKTEEDTKKIAKEIVVMLSKNMQGWTQLGLQEKQYQLDKIINEFNTNTPMKIGQWTEILGNLLTGAKIIMSK